MPDPSPDQFKLLGGFQARATAWRTFAVFVTGDLLLLNLNPLGPQTFGVLDKQSAELSRTLVTLLHPGVGGSALEVVPHDTFSQR